MPLELDHFYIWTDVGAPEAGRLRELGLVEGAPNIHPGQGTSCRRFFFLNLYVELLWVRDLEELRSGPAARLHLAERWEQRRDGACPFGFVFRPPSLEAATPPFRFELFRAPYLPPPLAIEVACNAGVLTEPMLLNLPFARQRTRDADVPGQPIEHPAGLRRVSRVNLISPRLPSPSAEWTAVTTSQLVSWRESANGEYCVEVGFDDERRGESRDLRPDLPLVLRW